MDQVHLYALIWNEAKMLPFFFRHYTGLVDRFFIFDNGSTDGSLDLLAGDPRVTVAHWDVQGDSFVREATELYNNFWKPSRGQAEWAIIVEVDEHLYHPDFRNYLRSCRDGGATIMRPMGYEMIADAFPAEDKPLWQLVTRGVRSAALDKMAIFDPSAIEAMNYGTGRHYAEPEGRLNWEAHPQITLLHYKRLGAAYVMERNKVLSRGIRPGDVAGRWGLHYFFDDDEVAAEHEQLSRMATPVPGLAGPPAVRAGGRLFDERERLRASGLFDEPWYLQTYPDVAAVGMDPLEHFCIHGWREGRKPNRVFDCVWYRETYAEVVGPDVNPLLDYVTAGEKAGRRPSPEFNPRRYRRRYRLSRDESPLRHHLSGAAARRRPGILMRVLGDVRARLRPSLPDGFDARAYFEANPDVAAAGVDAARHYLKWGRYEGRRMRKPSPDDAPEWFDPQLYLLANPDLDAGAVDPRRHYVEFGRDEGRRAPSMRDLPEQFDAQLYVEANPDVPASGLDPVSHYLVHGKAESRPLRPTDRRGLAQRAERQLGMARG